jgi:hypothetical protein
MKRWILWDFARASWQYDVIVGIILAFIFLTPRAWFRDQPRPHSVVAMPAESGRQVFWLGPETLLDVPEPHQVSRAKQVLQTHTGQALSWIQINPIFNSEGELKGYMVYATK